MAHAEEQDHAQYQRQPQGLTKYGADACVLAGAGQLGDRGRNCQHHPDRRDNDQRPDARANGNGGQCGRTIVPGEHRIDDIHANGRQLPKHDRNRQNQRFSKFAAQTLRLVKWQEHVRESSGCAV